MRVAVAGCCHGELDKIYETLALAERRGPGPIDLLLCCGDFQAVRNEADLRCMAVPPKYRHMQTFYRYYSGEKKAPVLTIFIGGNHEASNHLQELPYGGWVAPNIYYLGLAGVVKYRGVIEIEHDPSAPDYLEYDTEWLAILRATDDLINVTERLWNMPENNGLHTRWDYSATKEAMNEVLEKLNHDLKIPSNFSVTAPCYDPSKPQTQMQLVHRISPQTTEFCARLGITDINVRLQKAKEKHQLCDDYEGQDDVESNDSGEDPSEYNTDTSALSSINPDEIILDEEEEYEDSIVSAHSDMNTPSVDPSSDQALDFSASFSDVRILPSSMILSSDDTSGSPIGKEGKPGEPVELEDGKDLTSVPLKRLSDEREPEQRKKIKRRNQAIYAAVDDDDIA
ncbi:lariat debranching enzyme [Camelus ferus]|nr:lariat debranching enzyme [Camelus ferus]